MVMGHWRAAGPDPHTAHDGTLLELLVMELLVVVIARVSGRSCHLNVSGRSCHSSCRLFPLLLLFLILLLLLLLRLHLLLLMLLFLLLLPLPLPLLPLLFLLLELLF
jgi:hypothetical protein